MKGIFIYLLLLIFSNQCLVAQTFTARISAKTIGKNDRLQVDFIANNGALTGFKMPAFRGWVVLSGPNITTNQMRAGNVVKQQTIYSLTLVPSTTGRLIVPSATGLLNNRPVRTSPFTVDVKNTDHVQGSQRPQQSAQPQGSLFNQPRQRAEFGSDQYLRPGESARDKVNQNILVRAEANKSTALVGEPVLVTYKLYTRLRSQSKVVSQPSFSGVTVIEMTNENPLATRESLNGRMYNVYVLRRVQIIPLQEGLLEVPSASVENQVSFYSASGQSYRDMYYKGPTQPAEDIIVTSKSKPIQIDIKPLPPLPAVGPSEFSGAVGKYNISAAPTKSSIETNNTYHLVIVLVGEGNLQQMKAPVVQWPNQIEAFEPTIESTDDKTYFPVRTRKSFTYPFVVNQPGQYIIPPISFTYFDPAAARYITKKTVPLPLMVIKGTAKRVVTAVNNSSQSNFNNRLLIILGAGLVAVIIGLLWFRERNKTPQPIVAPVAAATTPPVEVAQDDTSKYLLQIRELWPGENTATFYKQLCNNVNGFINARLQIQPAQLGGFMLKHPAHQDALQQLQNLLDHCSLGMYTPIYTIDEAIQHRLKAIETLSRIDKEIF